MGNNNSGVSDFTWFILTLMSCGVFIGLWSIDNDGSGIGALIGFVMAIPLPILLIYLRLRAICNKNRQAREEKTRRENEKREAIRQSAQNGTWVFPAEKFYQQCTEQKVVNTSDEYGFKKAKMIAEQLIQEACPEVDISYFQSYLTKGKLQELLETGKSQAEQTAKKKLAESKRVREADADSYEATFMQRSSAVAKLTGCQKRVQMLTDLIGDYDEEIQKLKDGEEAMKQLAMIYTGAQKKESDWAILGGAANGIAGPVASAAVIWDTMKKNGEIAKYNEGMRKASMDVLSGTFSVAGNRIKAEEERENVKIRREEAREKITLSKPDANEIWNNIHIGQNYSVKRYDSGVLHVSISLGFLRSFALNVPQGVHMVVDGTIRAYVTMDGIGIGTAEFPLPLYGIPCDADAKVTLDGMCGWSTEFQGKYSLHFADQQNLWIMEA